MDNVIARQARGSELRACLINCSGVHSSLAIIQAAEKRDRVTLSGI